jgi:hypothetical protein
MPRDHQSIASTTTWYHACSGCTAKWFAPAAEYDCPRCGLLSQTTERLSPPWQRWAENQAERQVKYASSGVATQHAEDALTK